MKEFECKGCGMIVCIPADKNKGPVCPACRSVMIFVGNTEDQAVLKKFICSGCEEVFFMRKDKIPYKCPFCNYTFFVSPRLKQEERL
jgi:DNA-directed RNA polymerase subunit RPC12/RpoP